ncbi:hypothetical protein LHK_01480 [Laribacter hongkongensis HLHK9]|uniref:Uncharacterized protein n=1 Tax=Laribacter hongkongensis (strain HLHK9) TaxID=557598 RepID=C1D7M9_LARHH|nr:hypothetical protein LHK_01480 [Laribacter hongkongensis HLHK9]
MWACITSCILSGLFQGRRFEPAGTQAMKNPGKQKLAGILQPDA